MDEKGTDNSKRSKQKVGNLPKRQLGKKPNKVECIVYKGGVMKVGNSREDRWEIEEKKVRFW